MRVVPAARTSKLDRLTEDAAGAVRLRIRVGAPPDKGRANKALINLFAAKLRLPRSAIQIIAGLQSREKTLLLSGDTGTLLAKFDSLILDEEITG